MNSPVRLGVSPTTSTPNRCFQSEVLMLYFPVLEPWAAWSVSLPSCSSWFIHTQMWDPPVHKPPPRLVCQLPPCHRSSPPGCPSPPLLLVWNECFFFISLVVGVPYSLIFWQFWLFLNLLLSFFWLCEEAQCVYLCLHLPIIMVYLHSPLFFQILF